MVVDDEEFCIAAISAMLKRAGIDVQSHVDFCINGKEAVDKFISSHTMGIKYAIIFTDFMMPVMDGIDMTKMIRKHETNMHMSHTNIVGITAHFSESFKDKSIKAGMNKVCSKPFYCNDLNEILSQNHLLPL